VNPMKISYVFAVLPGVVLLAACAGEIANPEEFYAAARNGSGTCDAANVVQNILTPRCGACHSGQLQSGSLDLTSAGVADRIIGKAATCAGVTDQVVNSSDVTTGFLFQKITGTATCGTAMPPSGDRLSAADVDCIKDWLSQASGGS
jgi:hypothetical protein